MWLSIGNGNVTGRNSGRNGLVAVAIDNDKGSQNALKWAVENLLARGQTVILIHVVRRTSDQQTKELMRSFHIFCTRKDIQCYDVVLEDTEIARAITEYVAHAAIETLVLGASHHGFIKRLKMVDVPTSVSKAAPDFCSVYVISKTKISSVKNASRQASFVSPLKFQIQQMQEQANNSPTFASHPTNMPSMRGLGRAL